jgi:Mg2+/Co2+ transporter CorB
VEYEAWCELSTELQYTISDLSDNLLMLMDCASTSHRLNLALVHLIKVEDLRVVDIRKVMVVLDKNEETIRIAAELLHMNVRRAKTYSSESDQVMQWLRRSENFRLVSLEADKSRELCLRSASEVLVNRSDSVTKISAMSAGK